MHKLLFSFLLAASLSTTSYAQWSQLTTGQTDGYIMDYIRYNSEIYACGSITKIGGTPVNSVAKWDGAQWQPVGTTFTEWVHKLEPIGSDLYAMPYNTTTDSNHIYKWDGTQWKKYGKGFYLTITNLGSYHSSSLYDAIEYKGNLIVCGEFDRAGNNSISGIAQWNGTDWVSLGGGLTDPISGLNIYPHKIFVYNSNLFVVGNFKKAGGITVNGIAYWDGTQWHAMGNGFNAAVYGIEEYNGSIYVSGEFTQSGSTVLGCIAKWDGIQWVNPGINLISTITGYKAFAHTLKSITPYLYIAGGFSYATDAHGNTLNAKNVIAFDEFSSFNIMDGGTNSDAEGIVSLDTPGIMGIPDVLFGGGFNKAGTKSVNSHARWHPIFESVASILTNNDIKLYPNPVTDKLNIRIEKPENIRSMVVVNASGQEVIRVANINRTTMINLSQLAAGNYIIKIIDKENKQAIHSFAKQ